EDTVQAERGGAHSIEISHDLSVGGLTPPIDLVRAARDALKIDVHVIVRPHARDFVYDTREFDLILEQTDTLVKAGVTGVVFGAQRADGTLDTDMIGRVAEAAGDLVVTLHRALDTCADPEA